MNVNKITAFAPATVANVNVGFDLLGYAIENVGDTIIVEKIDEKKVIIESIQGTDQLPYDAEKNTAGKPLIELMNEKNLTHGFKVSIQKGIPIGSGLGGSAASAVGSIVAANKILGNSLGPEELLRYALEGEAVASGVKHPDNVVPCLFGGLCLTTTLKYKDIIKLPSPKVKTISFYPHISIKTQEARNLLRKEILLKEHTLQMSHLAGFISSLFTNDTELLKRHFNDFIVEPQRSVLIDGFQEAKAKAIELGALGFGISGSGPSLFCWYEESISGDVLKQEILQLLSKYHNKVDSWDTQINQKGTYIV